MKPFTYVLPKTLAEAAESAARPGATVKAAGLDLVDRMKERVLLPTEVVSLLPLRDELAGIAVEPDGGLRIGALTTLTQLDEAAALQGGGFAALREAAAVAATPQVRNRATIAGNVLQQTRCWYLRSAAFGCLHGKKGPLCLAQIGDHRYHAVLGYHDCVRVHPSNVAPALLALDAEFSSVLAGQTRRRKLAELFPAQPLAALAEHTLQDGEIVTAFHVPAAKPGARSAYAESREKLSFDWATTSAAVSLRIDDGIIRAATLVLGAVAPVPLPRPEASRLLVGQKPGDELFARVGLRAFADARPLAQNAYKLQVGAAIVREVLHAATR